MNCGLSGGGGGAIFSSVISVELFLFLQKSGGAKATPSPPSAWSPCSIFVVKITF